MSSSIAIPRRKKKASESSSPSAIAAIPSSSSSSATDSASPTSRFQYGSLESNASLSVVGSASERKANRRQSLMCEFSPFFLALES